MDDSDQSETPTTRRTGKVARLLADHGLDGLGAELERLWTAEGDDRRSLRELADRFNRRLLESVMADAGMQPIDGEVENVYRLLTDDEVGGADRTRARRRLEREGVDVDGLLEEFVSYQAIRTYLKEDRGAEYTKPETDRLDTDARSIRQLRGRLETVAETKLQGLRDAGHLDVGEFQVIVDARVLCEDCGTRYDVDELLRAGGCDCRSDG